MTTYTVTTLDDTVDLNDGKLSLREAITLANDSAEADTITFASNLSGGTIHLTGTFLTVTDSLAIKGNLDGNGVPDITIDASGLDASRARAFHFAYAASSVDGLTITGGHLGEDFAGGGIAVDLGAQLAISNSVLSGNEAGTGGAVSVAADSKLTVSGSIFYGNAAHDETSGYLGDGGAIWNNGGVVDLTDVDFSQNFAGGYGLAELAPSDAGRGGAIFNGGNGTLRMSSVTVEGGHADLGGGIYNASNATLKDVVISGNLAWVSGGGIYNVGVASLYDTTVALNTSLKNGGGITNDGYGKTGSLVLVNGTVWGNESLAGVGVSQYYLTAHDGVTYLITSVGGNGIYDHEGTLTVLDSTVSGNLDERGDGGGIEHRGGGALMLGNSIVAGNGDYDLVLDEYSHSTTFTGTNVLSKPVHFLDGDVYITDYIVEPDLSRIFAQVGYVGSSGLLAGVMADNGGPVPTILIRGDGVAHNAGDATTLPLDLVDLDRDGNPFEPLPVDARGRPRIVDGKVDVGAVEIATAHDDAFVTAENAVVSGNLFADNGSGADAGSGFKVTAVNGAAGNVGTAVVLPSGAKVTVGANGAMTYNPRHSFDTLPDFASSGASNTTATDHFTYTTTDGSIATVTVTIRGVDSNDILLGTTDNDTLRGGIGNDYYYVDNTGDRIVELAGQGNDTVQSRVTYTLPANVENLILTGNGALNGTGNELDNVITGNAGANVLRGGAGRDTISGGDGNDIIYGGDKGDFLFGDLGDDWIAPGGGVDKIDGGLGIDTVWYGDSPGGVTVDLGISKGARNDAAGDGSSTLNGLTITGGHVGADFGGGAVAADSGGDVTIHNSTLTGNSAGYGGAVAVGTGSTVTMAGTMVSDNATTARGYGGGIWNNGGAVMLTDVTLDGNSAAGGGGAIENDSGTVSLTRVTVSNGAAHFGGGLVNHGTAWLGDVTFTLNVADAGSGGSTGVGSGGAISNDGELTVTGGTFTDNSADIDGGAIYNVFGTLSLTDAIFSDNQAGTGGGVYNSHTATLRDVTFQDNSARFSGGGLYNSGTASVADATFSGNSAKNGGGVINSTGGTLDMANATLSGNSASSGYESGDGNGGGISNYATATLSNVTVSGNKAVGNGGGLYNGSDGQLTLANSIVAGNAAGASGPDLSDGGAVITFNGSNIFSQSGTFGAQDIVEPNLANIFAQVAVNPVTGVTAGVLADNGGSVATIAIKAGGTAQDAGFNTALPFDPLDLDGDRDTFEPLPADARGGARIAGGAVDIGAMELQGTPVARGDLVTTLENAAVSGNVFADNGAGRDVADGAIAVTAVNGVAADVGRTITLFSGASLKLNADGTFTYNPHHAFDDLADPATSNSLDTESSDGFIYTVTGGSTAYVSLNIHGVDSDDRVVGFYGYGNALWGGIGNDTLEGEYFAGNVLFGGPGNDTYKNPVPAFDTIVEKTGEGIDTVESHVSFTLPANVERLVLIYDDNIDGTGNDLDNTITGNSGDNLLRGEGARDYITGGQGSDTIQGGDKGDFLFGNKGDDLIAPGGGVDQIDGGLGIDTVWYGDSPAA